MGIRKGDTIFQRLAQNKDKRLWFYWKNKMKTKKYDFSDGSMSAEEFINTYLGGNKKKFDSWELWAKTSNYANLMETYYNQCADMDFIKMYEAVREKALQGDNASIKTFMMLQKEIKRHSNKKAEPEEDDGLEVQ
jgi:hypothetical protein